MQRSLPLLGNVKRDLHPHSAKEMALCTSMAQAVYLALVHGGLTQESAAQGLGVTDGYLSMLLNGKRRFNDEHIRRIVALTGSLAPLQWLCGVFGTECYADPIKLKRARAMADLAECDELERAA